MYIEFQFSYQKNKIIQKKEIMKNKKKKNSKPVFSLFSIVGFCFLYFCVFEEIKFLILLLNSGIFEKEIMK